MAEFRWPSFLVWVLLPQLVFIVSCSDDDSAGRSPAIEAPATAAPPDLEETASASTETAAAAAPDAAAQPKIVPSPPSRLPKIAHREETLALAPHSGVSRQVLGRVETEVAAAAASEERPGVRRRLDDYAVVLDADKEIKLPGVPGKLRVWIGDPRYKSQPPADMARAESHIPAVGDWARIEPFAPAFDIGPAKTECIKIDPTGAEVLFTLTPREAGAFPVGATVYLYTSPNCKGAPVPKTAESLVVTVSVDEEAIVKGKIQELLDVLWEKVVEFWGALLALLLGLVLFLLRDKLKQLFGYGGD